MKRQMDIQRILEDFKGVRNIPGINSAKKRVLITKIKNEKREIITSRKGIANVFGEFYTILYDDNDEQDESEQEIGENENESSTDEQYNNTTEIQEPPRQDNPWPHQTHWFPPAFPREKYQVQRHGIARSTPGGENVILRQKSLQFEGKQWRPRHKTWPSAKQDQSEGCKSIGKKSPHGTPFEVKETESTQLRASNWPARLQKTLRGQ